jgi:hypothetical protein
VGGQTKEGRSLLFLRRSYAEIEKRVFWVGIMDKTIKLGQTPGFGAHMRTSHSPETGLQVGIKTRGSRHDQSGQFLGNAGKKSETGLFKGPAMGLAMGPAMAIWADSLVKSLSSFCLLVGRSFAWAHGSAARLAHFRALGSGALVAAVSLCGAVKSSAKWDPKTIAKPVGWESLPPDRFFSAKSPVNGPGLPAQSELSERLYEDASMNEGAHQNDPIACSVSLKEGASCGKDWSSPGTNEDYMASLGLTELERSCEPDSRMRCMDGRLCSGNEPMLEMVRSSQDTLDRFYRDMRDGAPKFADTMPPAGAGD